MNPVRTLTYGLMIALAVPGMLLPVASAEAPEEIVGALIATRAGEHCAGTYSHDPNTGETTCSAGYVNGRYVCAWDYERDAEGRESCGLGHVI